MGWRDLIAKGNESVTAPWLGGKVLHLHDRSYNITGALPREHGWYTFKVEGRTVKSPVPSDPVPEDLMYPVRGYLIGDRIVSDHVRVGNDPKDIVKVSQQVHLLSEDLDRFARISAGFIYEGGPCIYKGLEMPLGPEEEVLQAYLDRSKSVSEVKGVTPSLDAAFRMETWQREEADRRREELERIRKEEEERRAREEKRRQLVEKLGDAHGRREMAKHDFGEAARAALAVGGAELLDHRKYQRRNEWVVRYRLDGRRFECICDNNLGIVDAGICLVDHDTGEKGDTYFTLESLPAVVRQAEREARLVVFRHI